MFKIIITIFLIIILIIVFNYLFIDGFEGFKNSLTTKSNSANSVNRVNSVNHVNRVNHVNHINSANGTNNLSQKNKEQKIQIDEKILFNNKDYNENLSIDNKDNQYFYTDMINQSNINETAFNIEYSIDPIDYSDVETGLEKCNIKCKGSCFENGYDGIATCYPVQSQPFDWGTLYKNPTFTYGYNAWGPEDLKK